MSPRCHSWSCCSILGKYHRIQNSLEICVNQDSPSELVKLRLTLTPDWNLCHGAASETDVGISSAISRWQGAAVLYYIVLFVAGSAIFTADEAELSRFLFVFTHDEE